jgi:hypothetical protein
MSKLVNSISKLNYLTKAACNLSGSDPWNANIAGAKTIYGTNPNTNPLLATYTGDHNIFVFESNLITCGTTFKFKNISYSNKYIAQFLKCGSTEEFTRTVKTSLYESSGNSKIADSTVSISDAMVIGSSNQMCPAGQSGCGTQDCDVRCTQIPRGFVVKDMGWIISSKSKNTAYKSLSAIFSKITYPSFSGSCQLGCSSSTLYQAGPRPSVQYVLIKKFYDLQGNLVENNHTRVGIGNDLQDLFILKPCGIPSVVEPVNENAFVGN